jgi:glutathione S-transferase
MHSSPSPSSSSSSPSDLEKLEEGLKINVGRDLDWLDAEREGRRFLAGDGVSAADTMCGFSVRFIFERGLCDGNRRERGEWGNVERWLERCEGCEGWMRAVERTGYRL